MKIIIYSGVSLVDGLANADLDHLEYEKTNNYKKELEYFLDEKCQSQ